MKKRIIAIDQGEHLGGAERFFSEILTRLKDFEVHLITGSNSEYKKLYRGSTVIIHELNLPKLKPITFNTYLKFKKTQKEIALLIQQIKPKKIISNTVRTHLLISALAKKNKIPLIWMAHDKTFPSAFLKWFIRYPQTVISCSRFIQNHYRQQSHKRGPRFEVIYPFGIDTNELEQLETIKKEKIIGMIGKFIPWKNQKTFIELAAEIKYYYPDYRFVIIGSPYILNSESEEYYEECKKYIHENNLSNIIKIKDNVHSLLKEISKWKFLIHCSKDPEPLGRVILEGMAVGCAVVASPFGGPSEIIKHRHTGILAKPEVETLKKELFDLIKKDDERIEMIKASQNEIKEKYNWDKVINKFELLI